MNMSICHSVDSLFTQHILIVDQMRPLQIESDKMLVTALPETIADMGSEPVSGKFEPDGFSFTGRAGRMGVFNITIETLPLKLQCSSV